MTFAYDEFAAAGAFLLGEHAGFITGTDPLIDGGPTDLWQCCLPERSPTLFLILS